MSYIPDQGDIVWVNCDPSAGQEIQKRRPALIVSKRIYSETTGFAVMVPIKTRFGGHPMEVLINGELKTTGAAQVHQFRSVDYRARETVFIEKAPLEILIQASGLIHLVTAIVTPK